MKENNNFNLTNEEIMIPMLIAKIIEENPQYILNSYYDLNIEYGEVEISCIKNVFEEVSPQFLCLKLVHNISMMSAFAMNYIVSSKASIENLKSRNKSLFLRLSVGHENINIVQKKGFGLFGYNIDDMAYALYSFYEGMYVYLQKLSVQKKYAFLERVLKEYTRLHLLTTDPNQAIKNFLNSNKDFYEKQIQEIEKLLEKE